MTSIAENSLVQMIDNLPLGEKLLKGLTIAISGILVVFFILIIVMAITYLLKVFFYKKPTVATQVNEEIISSNQIVVEETDNNELIAVITAAIQASRVSEGYAVDDNNFRVVSFKRTSKAWKKVN